MENTYIRSDWQNTRLHCSAWDYTAVHEITLQYTRWVVVDPHLTRFRRRRRKNNNVFVFLKNVYLFNSIVFLYSLIGSVDDHFARALGDQMWTEIKARSEPPSFDSLPGSVDAHFAKALGAAMWKKLKAENKLADDVISTNPSQTQSQQLEDPPNQQKSPPSSPLQKPLITWKHVTAEWTQNSDV